MSISLHALFPFLVALSFAIGLNTYATVATLGLMARLGWLDLPHGLLPLADTWVIAGALVLFGCEFFADKIPFVDLAWNFAHTLVRVPVAALLAWRASAPLSPGQQALVVAVSAAVALAAHGGKTGLRTLVTASPEPLSNIALSSGEDLASVALTWAATRHPLAAAIAVVVLVVMLVGFARWLFRALGREVRRLRTRFGPNPAAPNPAAPNPAAPNPARLPQADWQQKLPTPALRE